MKKDGNTTRYASEEIDNMVAKGRSQTDWKRINTMSNEEIEEGANQDPDSPQFPYDKDFWRDAEVIEPKTKISIRLDRKIIDYFKRSGSGYQKRINAVLGEYVRHRLHHSE